MNQAQMRTKLIKIGVDAWKATEMIDQAVADQVSRPATTRRGTKIVVVIDTGGLRLGRAA
jgi:hypothetical protein